jgi:hypothetical protein
MEEEFASILVLLVMIGQLRSLQQSKHRRAMTFPNYTKTVKWNRSAKVIGMMLWKSYLEQASHSLHWREVCATSFLIGFAEIS